MDGVSNSNSKTDCDSSEAQPLSVGGMLGKAREDLGLSVADVEKRLKFTPRQIQALEADDFNYLQDIHFVRRFVHGYARLVQLEPAHLLALLPEAPAPSHPVAHAADSDMSESRRRSTHSRRGLSGVGLAALAGVLIAILVGLFVWLDLDRSIALRTKVEALPLPTTIAVPPMGASTTPPAETLTTSTPQQTTETPALHDESTGVQR